MIGARMSTKALSPSQVDDPIKIDLPAFDQQELRADGRNLSM